MLSSEDRGDQMLQSSTRNVSIRDLTEFPFHIVRMMFNFLTKNSFVFVGRSIRLFTFFSLPFNSIQSVHFSLKTFEAFLFISIRDTKRNTSKFVYMLKMSSFFSLKSRKFPFLPKIGKRTWDDEYDEERELRDETDRRCERDRDRSTADS